LGEEHEDDNLYYAYHQHCQFTYPDFPDLQQVSDRMAKLKDILHQQRKLNFVGRQQEIAFFDSLLEAKSPYHLLYIHGAGGQGKTSLIKQYADRCREKAIPFFHLDCRYIEANPDNFRLSFQLANPFPSAKDVTDQVEKHQGKVLLFIDTYEKLKPLDDWLRMIFLPELPDNIITVIAGRTSFSTSWKSDPGWQPIIRIIKLADLSKDESLQLLKRRNIPGEQLTSIVDYTHGNPLALSIVADMFDQRKISRFDPMQSPDIMKTLLDQFVQEVPSPAHKAALELSSLVYVTTEKIIEEVLGPQMAGELFNWLSSLTIIEKGPTGIYPHDMARDAIASELHWRNPEWYRHLHIKIQQYFISRILKHSGEKQRNLIFNLIFLHRMNPAVKNFFEFQETGSSWQDKPATGDQQAVIEMVKKYEGEQSAKIFSAWLNHEAADLWIYRDAEKIPAGFVLKINLEKISKETHDETVNVLLSLKTQFNIKDGELMTVFRSWMSRDHYQNVSGVQSAIFLGIVQWYFTPSLAVSMLNTVHPEFWKQILEYADLTHLSYLDYEMNNQVYGWYMHDWRKRDPVSWLELMGKKEINEEEETGSKPSAPALITEEHFIQAVHDALKNIKNPKKLVGNKLLETKLVKKLTGEEHTPANLALTLADKLVKTIAQLENSPKDETLHRVMYRTFINPVGGQEQTADFLYLSFSTYRRYVKKGVERIADMLWLEENAPSN
jgi:hypothetical protein